MLRKGIVSQTVALCRVQAREFGVIMGASGKTSALTDLQCRKAASRDRDFKLTDGQGLFLYVTTKGHKSWRFKYRFADRQKQIVIGPYPEISLDDARVERVRFRALLRANQDPLIVRKQEKAATRAAAASTFEKIGRQWHAVSRKGWSERHATKILESLELHLFPTLGRMPINDITPPMMLEAIRAVEKGSIDIAKRVQRRASKIFSYAIAAGIGMVNPAAAIKDALQPLIGSRLPAIVNLPRLRSFLLSAEEQDAEPQTRLANRFLAITQARPSMVRLMPPSEIFDLDGDQPQWRIPAARMKLAKDKKLRFEYDFIVPLCSQAVDVLREARSRFGNAAYVFPSPSDPRKPMSDATLAKFLKLKDYPGEHVPHGWRSSFSTIMNEKAAIDDRPSDRPIIDLMLAHLPSDVESIYNRYLYLPRRTELSQEWADMLLEGFGPASSLMRDMPPRGVVRTQATARERPDIRRGPRKQKRLGAPRLRRARK
ncbi:integrase arm-type DNA-binding domain-containing protein [Sphingomonadaceae bacterium G21617-S1]|nr:integrase arm-type DNA-binding domain-containing protein [Sphingomonadaceae bacterium G21617-S1]